MGDMDWCRGDDTEREESLARMADEAGRYEHIPVTALRDLLENEPPGGRRLLMITAAIARKDYPRAWLPPDSRGLSA